MTKTKVDCSVRREDEPGEAEGEAVKELPCFSASDRTGSAGGGLDTPVPVSSVHRFADGSDHGSEALGTWSSASRAAGKFATILAKSLTPPPAGGRPALNGTHFVRWGGSLRRLRHNQPSFCWTSGAQPLAAPSARRGIFWNEGRTCVPGTPGYGSSIHRSIYEISLNNGRIGYGTSSRKAAKLLDRPACVAHSPFRRLALGGSRICCSKLLVFTELG